MYLIKNREDRFFCPEKTCITNLSRLFYWTGIVLFVMAI